MTIASKKLVKKLLLMLAKNAKEFSFFSPVPSFIENMLTNTTSSKAKIRAQTMNDPRDIKINSGFSLI